MCLLQGIAATEVEGLPLCWWAGLGFQGCICQGMLGSMGPCTPSCPQRVATWTPQDRAPQNGRGDPCVSLLVPHSGACHEGEVKNAFSGSTGAGEALSSGRGAEHGQLLCLLIQSKVAGAEAACGVSKTLYFTFDILFRSIWIP